MIRWTGAVRQLVRVAARAVRERTTLVQAFEREVAELEARAVELSGEIRRKEARRLGAAPWPPPEDDP